MSMTEVCVTIRESSGPPSASLLRRCRSAGADLVEIRLDHLDRLDWGDPDTEAIRSQGLGSILTVRPSWDGGLFRGSEEDRAATMKVLIDTHPTFVDIEMRMDPALRDPLVRYAKDAGVGTIISYHDHKGTPLLQDLEVILDQLAAAGADSIKMAFRCESSEDSLCLIEACRLARDRGLKYSIMGMGPRGHLTRVLAPQMGCGIVYAAFDDPTGSDQIDIRTLRRILSLIGVDEGGDPT